MRIASLFALLVLLPSPARGGEASTTAGNVAQAMSLAPVRDRDTFEDVVRGMPTVHSGKTGFRIHQDIYQIRFESGEPKYDTARLEEELAKVKEEFFLFTGLNEFDMKACDQIRIVHFYVTDFQRINRRERWPKWMSKISKKDDVFGAYDLETGANAHNTIGIMYFNVYDLDIGLLGHEMAHFMYDHYCLTALADDTETFAVSFGEYLKDKY